MTLLSKAVAPVQIRSGYKEWHVTGGPIVITAVRSLIICRAKCGQDQPAGRAQTPTNRASEAPKSGRSGASLNSAGAEPGWWSAGAARPSPASSLPRRVVLTNRRPLAQQADSRLGLVLDLPRSARSCSLAAVSACAIRTRGTGLSKRLNASLQGVPDVLAADPSRIVLRWAGGWPLGLDDCGYYSSTPGAPPGYGLSKLVRSELKRGTHRLPDNATAEAINPHARSRPHSRPLFVGPAFLSDHLRYG